MRNGRSLVRPASAKTVGPDGQRRDDRRAGRGPCYSGILIVVVVAAPAGAQEVGGAAREIRRGQVTVSSDTLWIRLPNGSHSIRRIGSSAWMARVLEMPLWSGVVLGKGEWF